MTGDNNNAGVKPNYGYYIPFSFIILFGIIGGIGLVLIIFGFFVRYPWNVILWISGALLSILFFWPVIGFLRENIRVNRQKVVHYDFLTKFKAPEILDCGCGTGRYAIQIAKQMPKGGFLTGIDIFDPRAVSGNSLERVQRNAKLEGVVDKTKFMEGSIIDIPFNNELFDIVTCMTVLHEVRGNDNRKKAFQEIYRVLKPHGIFYMTELDRKASILSSGFTAFAFQTKAYWEDQLNKYRFRIIKINSRGNKVEFLTKK